MSTIVDARATLAHARFVDRIEFSAEGCWLWTGPTDHGGYGRIEFLGRHIGAHRWSYEWYRGPIPAGMHIDHLCSRPRCVNPLHLEPVAPGENQRRRSERQTHCKWGHEFTPENTRVWKGKRDCKTCAKARMQQYQSKQRATAGDQPTVAHT